MIWLNVAVKPKFSWPNKQVELDFERRKLVLSGNTKQYAPTVSLYDKNGVTFETDGSFLCRFLSRLAWSMNSGITDEFFTGSNNPKHPGLLGRSSYSNFDWISCDPWETLYIPNRLTTTSELALALYREGMSLDSSPFAFLSFFKILNIQHSDGRSQKNWINNNIHKVSGTLQVQRLLEIQSSHSNIAEYLYEQGRCAIAHANNSHIVNPDNYTDKHRLGLDLPLMKELASIFIEKEFGVPSAYSFNKHDVSGNTEDQLIKTECNGIIQYLPLIRLESS